MSKNTTLLKQLNILVLVAVLLPSLAIIGMSYASLYDQIKTDKIREVQGIATSRKTELVSRFHRIQSRAEHFITFTERRCQALPDPASCLQSAMQVYIADEQALGAAYRKSPQSQSLLQGTADVGFEAVDDFKSEQFVSFKQQDEPHNWSFQVFVKGDDGAGKFIVTYPAMNQQELFAKTKDELGETGEIFLSDNKGFFITPPRYSSPEGHGHSHPISVDPMKACLAGNSGHMLDVDYRGVNVIHGYAYVPEIGGGCIMAHTEQDEAFSPVHTLWWQFFLITLACCLLALTAARLASRKVVRPINQLTGSIQGIIDGNYLSRVPVSQTTELARLAQMFNQMAETLGGALSQLQRANGELSAANLLNSQILSSAQEGIIAFDRHGRITLWNLYMEKLTGLAASDCLGKTVEDLNPQLQGSGIAEGIHKALQGESVRLGPLYWHFPHSDRQAWIIVTQSPIRQHDGKIVGVIETVSDVTEVKQAEEEKELAHLIFMNSSEGMVVTNDNNTIIATNPAFTALTGYSETDVLGKTPSILQSGKQDGSFYKLFWSKLNEKGKWAGEIWNKRKDGELYAEWLTINTIFDQDGGVFRRVGLFSDITKRKHTEELIWKQANFDTLTGLPNRRMFRDRLELAIKKAKRSGLSVVLMFIDLDHFKEINDVFGHEVGDLLLREASERLLTCVRATDIVARLGGDEFTIILDEIDAQDSIDHVAKTVLEKMAAPFELDDNTGYISASIGITYYPKDAADAEELIRNADQAMYAAKNQGRNCCYYFDAILQENAKSRMKLLSDLHLALDADQFLLHYQPIFDMQTGEVAKVEALIRWQHPQLGLLPPDQFIHLAEEGGMIVEIGAWVLREACVQNMVWRNQGHPPIVVTVNVSARQFQGMTLPGYVMEALKFSGLPPDGLEIEITEGMLMDNAYAAIATLQEIRELGVKISEDDFGTGYSSLSYLRQFPIDCLKIDQSFIRNLTHESEDDALVSAIIAMGNSLHVSIVAEGVETQEQVDILRRRGCTQIQGFLLGRPMSNQDFLAFMGQTKSRSAGAPELQ